MTRMWVSKLILVFGCLGMLKTSLTYAEVYTWTDSSGVVHFSDSPGPNAKPVQIKETPSYAPVAASTPPAAASSTLQKPATNSPYTSVRIVEPANDVTIRNPDGYIPVKVEVQPKLGPKDGLQLFLDNQAVGQPQSTGNFTLNGVDRGSHQIKVNLVDAQGKIILSTDTITVYMMQSRVNMGPMNQNHPP